MDQKLNLAHSVMLQIFGFSEEMKKPRFLIALQSHLADWFDNTVCEAKDMNTSQNYVDNWRMCANRN